MGALFYIGKRHTKPGEEVGQGTMRLISNHYRTSLLGINMVLLFSEALIAGSIHPKNELYIAPEGRMLQHLIISVAGLLMTVMFTDMMRIVSDSEERAKRTVMSLIIGILFSGVLTVGIPCLNIVLIAKGYGHHATLMDFMFKVAPWNNVTDWESYKAFYHLPKDYSPFGIMPYGLVGVIGGATITFLLLILELSNSYSIWKMEKKAERQKIAADAKKAEENAKKQSGNSDKNASDKSDKKGESSQDSKKKDGDDNKDVNELEYKVAQRLAKDKDSIKPLFTEIKKAAYNNMSSAIFSIAQDRMRTMLAETADATKIKERKQLCGFLVNKIPPTDKYKEFGNPNNFFGLGISLPAIKDFIDPKYLVTPK